MTLTACGTENVSVEVRVAVTVTAASGVGVFGTESFGAAPAASDWASAGIAVRQKMSVERSTMLLRDRELLPAASMRQESAGVVVM